MATRILQGDARERLAELPAASVQLCICSPPYYSLRSYGTEPQVWDAPAGGCEHVWGEEETWTIDARTKATLPSDLAKPRGYGRGPGDPPKEVSAAFCTRCGAWRGELGLEPTVEAYVRHLVEVFAAVRRVLRDDGVLAINLGDSYASRSGSGQGVNARHTRGAQRWENAVRGIKIKDLPPGSLMGVPWRCAFALQADGWRLRSAMVLVKCLSGGTVVYARTQKGEMPTTLKDLVRLKPETVQLWNGEKWTQVLSFEETAPNPGRQHVEIEFRNGERIGCTREHLWPTQRGNVRAEELRLGDVVPHCRLPEPDPPRQPAALDDELVGWFVGLYIAEGCAHEDYLRISGHARETERHARLREFVAAFDGYMTLRCQGNKANVTIHGPIIRAILDTYVNGKGAAGKHLHPRAWQRSDAFLRAVLQGYLDGDGGRRDKEKFWTLGFCCNDAWAQDLRTLGGRLGVKVFLRRVKHRMGEREFPGWKGYVRLTPTDHHSAKAPGEVVAIRFSRARKFWDVAVADEPHTFALASGLLTHNSAPMPESVAGVRWQRCRVKVKEGLSERVASGSTVPDNTPHRGPNLGGSVAGLAEWADCPGCQHCEQNDGLVLRWGSGRPTSAYEMLFVLTKSARYFWNSEAVRLPNQPQTIERARYSGKDLPTAWITEGTRPRPAERSGKERVVLNPAGANARNWMMWQTSQLKENHYAAFGRFIPEFAIRAATPERCCGACGSPYAVVIPRYNSGDGPLPLHPLPTAPPEGGLRGGQPEDGRAATVVPGVRPEGQAEELECGPGEVAPEPAGLSGGEPGEGGGTQATVSAVPSGALAFQCAPPPVGQNGTGAEDDPREGPALAQDGEGAHRLPDLVRPATGAIGRGTGEVHRAGLDGDPGTTGEPLPLLSGPLHGDASGDHRSRRPAEQGGSAQPGERGRRVSALQLAQVEPRLEWRPTCTCQAEPKPSLVLDPFGGSGTTALAAERLGRDCTLIDLQPDYVAIAERRAQQDAGLFGEVTVEEMQPEANGCAQLAWEW